MMTEIESDVLVCIKYVMTGSV